MDHIYYIYYIYNMDNKYIYYNVNNFLLILNHIDIKRK